MLGTITSSDGVHFFYHVQFVAAKADYFDIEIVIDKLQFVTQGHKSIGAVEQAAKNIGQLGDHLARGIGINTHQ